MVPGKKFFPRATVFGRELIMSQKGNACMIVFNEGKFRQFWTCVENYGGSGWAMGTPFWLDEENERFSGFSKEFKNLAKAHGALENFFQGIFVVVFVLCEEFLLNGKFCRVRSRHLRQHWCPGCSETGCKINLSKRYR